MVLYTWECCKIVQDCKELKMQSHAMMYNCTWISFSFFLFCYRIMILLHCKATIVCKFILGVVPRLAGTDCVCESKDLMSHVAVFHTHFVERYCRNSAERWWHITSEVSDQGMGTLIFFEIMRWKLITAREENGIHNAARSQEGAKTRLIYTPRGVLPCLCLYTHLHEFLCGLCRKLSNTCTCFCSKFVFYNNKLV